MNKGSAFYQWGRKVGFVTICFFLILLTMLPFDQSAGRWPAPALVEILTIAMLIRRPDVTPFWVIGGVFLLNDVLHMQPLGLWSLIIVAVTEFIRANLPAFRSYHFIVEWLVVSLLIVAALLIQQILLAILFVPMLPTPGLSKYIVSTALAYPLVVGCIVVLLRVRKSDIEVYNSARSGI